MQDGERIEAGDRYYHAYFEAWELVHGRIGYEQSQSFGDRIRKITDVPGGALIRKRLMRV